MTKEQLKAILPSATDKNIDLYYPFLIKYMAMYGIESTKQKAAFIAQVAHESNYLSVVTENLNYSANGLLSTFKKYFTADQAADYARQPERIANRVYANRIGNGDESCGDGWRFRGRGLIQITGRENYSRCEKALKIGLLNNPDLLATPEYAVQSACWWWQNAKLNEVAG